MLAGGLNADNRYLWLYGVLVKYKEVLCCAVLFLIAVNHVLNAD